MIYTTLNKIFSISPPEDTRAYLLQRFSNTATDDELISLESLIELTSFDFVLDCCQLFPEFDNYWRLYAVWCAKQCPGIKGYESGYNAILVAERFAKGDATQEEFRKMQEQMKGHFNLEDGAPGKTAAGVTHENASLGTKITALSAIRGISNYEGLKAMNEVSSTGDRYGDDMDAHNAYDVGKSEGYYLAYKALKEEFIRLLRRLN